MDLKSCSNVFVWQDAVRRLKPLLDRKGSWFQLLTKGKQVWISINRFKPAFQFLNSESYASSPPQKDSRTILIHMSLLVRKSRYGRKVKLKLDSTLWK
ncbi:hypothetical protein TNCT_721851 [Trichonephila clavata]|uniref:Uncharacterized protein n=1 Tax=Trichonephila clavata TaxID=2740835 RepID=A0A8X6J079_TRICU|nr:hypothetical protein TNCT_721851 [Trichonephila clavata]